MLPKKFRDWLAQFRNHYITYSNGFFHLPYNGKSPETLVDSLKGLPFVKYSPLTQGISTSTPLMEGGLYYRKLEEGCWLTYSRMRYKANVAFDLFFDEDSVSDCYHLSLNYVDNNTRAYGKLLNGYRVLAKYSWTLFKPRCVDCHLNFKGDDGKFITLFFTEAWLQQNLMSSPQFIDAGLARFVESSSEGFMVWPLAEQDARLESYAFFEKLMNVDGQALGCDPLQLKASALNLIFAFLSTCSAHEDVMEGVVAVDHDDRGKLQRVENYLSNNLYGKFPGLDFLAEEFDISHNRLKGEFKQLFGKPVYQYYQVRQMQLARAMLKNRDVLVKSVALKLGYQNLSKFSSAFKKVHGVLPSELN